MTKIYFDDDGDLALLEGKTISILGYGNQGRSQALNMRDCGIRVVIGNVRDASFDRAIADGFETHDIAGAVSKAGYHFLLVPDEVMPAIFERDIRPHLRPDGAVTAVPLLAGDVDWRAVREELAGIGYDGWLIAEVYPHYRFHSERLIYETSAAIDAIFGVGAKAAPFAL